MAELVDAADLKSVDHCDRGSSSLPTPINFHKEFKELSTPQNALEYTLIS